MTPTLASPPAGPTATVDPSLALETASRDLLDQLDQRPALSRLAMGIVDSADYADTLACFYRAEAMVEASIRRALPAGDDLSRRLDGTARLAADLRVLGATLPTAEATSADRFRPGPDFAIGMMWALWFRHRRDPALVRRLRQGWPAAPTAYLAVKESDIDRFWGLQKRLSAADPAEAAAGGRHGLATILEAVGG